MSGIKYKKNNVTFGTSFRNEDDLESMSLKLDGNLISVSIGELKKNGAGEIVRVDDSSLEIKFGAMNLHLLIDVFEDAYAAFQNDKKFEPEAVVSGGQGNQMIQISDGSNIDRPYGLYVIIFKDANVDEDFANCKHRAYRLSSKKTIIGFNKGKGHKVKERKIEAKVFLKQLNNYSDQALGGIQHAVKEATKFDTDKLISGITALCAHYNISFIGERSPAGQPRGIQQMIINTPPETYSLTDIPEKGSAVDYYDGL